MPRPGLGQAVLARSEEHELCVLWEPVLFFRVLVVCVEEEDQKAAWTQLPRRVVHQVEVDGFLAVLLLHARVEIVCVRRADLLFNLLLLLLFNFLNLVLFSIFVLVFILLGGYMPFDDSAGGVKV